MFSFVLAISILSIPVFAASNMFTTDSITFNDILQSFNECKEYDILGDYMDVEAEIEKKKEHNVLQSHITLTQFMLLLYQSSENKYRTKEIMSLNDDNLYYEYIRAQKWLFTHCKIPTWQYSMRIKMKNPTRTNIIGRNCIYLQKNQCTNDFDWLGGQITGYDATNNKHKMQIGSEYEWISFATKVSQGTLHIIERIDTNTAISPRVSFFLNYLVERVQFTPHSSTAPIWSQFQESEYGNRMDLWINLKFQCVCLQTGDDETSFHPTFISIGSTLELRDGSKIVCCDFNGNVVKYYVLLTYTQFAPYIKRNYPTKFNAVMNSEYYRNFNDIPNKQNVVIAMFDKLRKTNIMKLK
eukprot:153729_1